MTLEEKKHRRIQTSLSILLITLVTIVAYGFMVPKLGFYRDDWYMIWSAQAQGAEGVMNLFKSDRPFIGVLYAFNYSLLGKSALNWHIYALLVKLVGGLSLYWLLRMLWSRRWVEATFTVLLFMVYPGFYQQPNAALFINLLLSHSAAVLSLALTVYAIKSKTVLPQIVATLLALGLALFYLIIYEAMIGMEVARLLIVAYAIYLQDSTKKWKSILLSTVKRAIPFVIAALGFVYWRIFIFQSTRRATNVDVLLGEFGASPRHSVFAILIETAKDFFDTTIFAWFVPLYQNVTYSKYRDLGESLVLAAIAIGLVIACSYWLKRQTWLEVDEAQRSNDSLHMIVLGALVVFFNTLPIVLAGRDASFSFQWDRYTIQSSFGVAVCVVGVAFRYVRRPARWVFLYALIASGVVTQYHSAVYYRDFWAQERDMWWQLSWRAPDLQPGTTVIAAPPPGYRFLEEYEVWGPLNIVYNPGEPLGLSGQVPFDGIEELLASGEKEKRNMRSVAVLRDYSMPLVISKPTPNSCLHVINGQRLELPFEEESRMVAIAPYSRTDFIITEAIPRVPPADVFGREPRRDWCYYYQKIDLARQLEDWEEAARLADEAMRLGFLAADRSEWLPVIESYVNIGNMEKASELAQKIRTDKNTRVTLCDQLEGTGRWSVATDSVTLIKLICNSGNE